MELTLQQIEKTINKRLRTNQLLLAISIILAIGIVALKPSYLYWSFYFMVIGALNLPNINKCKKDLNDYKKNELDSTQGKVLDLFPEKDEDGSWIIFMEVEGQKDIKEFTLPIKPSVEINSEVTVYHTKVLQIPTKLQCLQA